MRLRLLSLVGLTVATSLAWRPSAPSDTPDRAEIIVHDNEQSSGVLRDGVLELHLVAGQGTWYPEAREGPGHDLYAFGEEGHALSNPGPLIRVPAGTEVRVTIRNAIDSAALTVHGLFDRPGEPRAVTIPGRATQTVSFKLTEPGSYYYWASTPGRRSSSVRSSPRS